MPTKLSKCTESYRIFTLKRVRSCDGVNWVRGKGGSGPPDATPRQNNMIGLVVCKMNHISVVSAFKGEGDT
jgi:hypothetical protein